LTFGTFSCPTDHAMLLSEQARGRPTWFIRAQSLLSKAMVFVHKACCQKQWCLGVQATPVNRISVKPINHSIFTQMLVSLSPAKPAKQFLTSC